MMERSGSSGRPERHTTVAVSSSNRWMQYVEDSGQGLCWKLPEGGGGIGFGIGLAKGTDWTKKNRRKKNENKFEGGWLDPMVNQFPNGLVLERFGEGRF